MNAAAWFYGQSFCGRSLPERRFICIASAGGGKYIVSLPESKVDEFRREQESHGCTVETREVR